MDVMFEGKYRRRAPLRIKTCDKCREFPGEFRRQGSAYNNEASNWNYMCEPCQEEADEYWKEMWAEYRASVMC
jgi:hypothetical protein